MAQAPLPEEYQGYQAVTAGQMREIEERCEHEFGVRVTTLMENAGRAVAEEVRRFIREKLQSAPETTKVLVCCGRGHNGGDGLVAARLLHGAGVPTEAFLLAPKKGKKHPPAVSANLERAAACGISIHLLEEDSSRLARAAQEAQLLVDAVLGTGSAGKPAGPAHVMIQKMMAAKKPILSVDIPSGLNADTGYHSGAFICAALTLTLGLPKRGLLAPHAQRYVGELKVAEIGFPQQLLKKTKTHSAG